MKVKAIALYVVALALIGQAYGQSVKRHPGDVLHYQVKFEGGDASKLTAASVHFQTRDQPPADQQLFNSQFGGNCGAPVAPGTFECSVKIPEDISNGTYKLFQVNTGSPLAGSVYHQDLIYFSSL